MSLFARIDGWLAPAPDKGKADWLKEWSFAHRGLHGAGANQSVVPENSGASARGAVAAWLGIECDIQLSRDGCPMVFHDWDLKRLLGAEGRTDQFFAHELKYMRYPGTDEAPIELGDLLAIVDGRVPLLIEIKSKAGYDVVPSCRVVRDTLYDYAGLFAVMSFDPRVSHWFNRNSPETVRGLVVTEEGAKTTWGNVRRHLALWHARPDFLAYDIRDLPSSFASSQRKRGIPLATWTVRNGEQVNWAKIHADAAIAEADGVKLS